MIIGLTKHFRVPHEVPALGGSEDKDDMIHISNRLSQSLAVPKTGGPNSL
jgi:hypothetical protein